ncbi:DUF547 domain-containing protein [Endozoicomonas euniceicola]|uniref:DUF547 domain-containing protein n=1 Tax=Endozoicomonas euniceicola TaxID=1234143 RepID=A0ABY6GWQ7_9GAMM|nr:DUF547 domain-containing protein [Endozoicomonas euniceicola]UYM17100.1 DUF547 domain-containing protein [Endozoicomonas euniceicola]
MAWIRGAARLMMLLCLTFQVSVVWAAPEKDYWPFWDRHDPRSKLEVDHSDWQLILDKYVRFSEKQQMYTFVYGGVSRENSERLRRYLKSLSDYDPRTLNRNEQLAYWVNLYNALTVELILKNYPVKSITKLGKGWFRIGPWDDKLITIAGKALSLNDIEHRILRPVWNNARIHYAVNCASIGCPDLAPEAYSGKRIEAQMDEAARRFINQSKGVNFVGKRLVLSKIFEWYGDDFVGKDSSGKEFSGKEGVWRELLQFAEPGLRIRLESYKGGTSYHYNWQLNEFRR